MNHRWVPVVVFVAWSLAVAGALASTLQSLSTGEFDGLNNALQIPFAVPWFLLPLPALTGWSHETDAWVTAGMGSLNAVLVAIWLVRRSALRRAADL